MSMPPGTSITGQGRVPASCPVKWATSGPGGPLGAVASTSNLVTRSDHLAHHFGGLARFYEDLGDDIRFLRDRLGSGRCERLGLFARFGLDRRLDAAKGKKILRRHDCQHHHRAAGPRGAAGRKTQGQRRFGTVVDYHQIRPHQPRPQLFFRAQDCVTFV